MSGRLDGKVALVAGGAGGIGSAAVAAFASEGARVLVADLDGGAARALADRCGSAVTSIEHDATSAADWDRVLGTARQRFGALHVLVNCVGCGEPGPIDVESLEHWQKLMRLNADTVFLGLRYAIPVIAASGGGSIVNFASTMALRPRPETAGYAAGKAAVVALSQSAALRCGALGNGVRVNCVVPGAIHTAMVDDMIDGLVRNGVIPDADAGLAMYAAAHPIGRIGRPADVVGALVFLASDESSFVTGTTLAVDGGYSAA